MNIPHTLTHIHTNTHTYMNIPPNTHTPVTACVVRRMFATCGDEPPSGHQAWRQLYLLSRRWPCWQWAECQVCSGNKGKVLPSRAGRRVSALLRLIF